MNRVDFLSVSEATHHHDAQGSGGPMNASPFPNYRILVRSWCKTKQHFAEDGRPVSLVVLHDDDVVVMVPHMYIFSPISQRDIPLVVGKNLELACF